MPHLNGSGVCRTLWDSQRHCRQSSIRHVSLSFLSWSGQAETSSDCVSKFELHKIYDTQLTPEQADELAMAEAAVRAFVSWDISWESVDVAMQVRDMLEKCELEVKEMLEADKEGDGEGGDDEGDEVEEEGVVEDEVGGGVAEVAESDEEERSSEVARGGVVRVGNESDDEDEGSE